MTFVMYVRSISILLKMSPQKLIFSPTRVVFCAPVFCCLSCSRSEIACQFKMKTEILPKLPGVMEPEGLDRSVYYRNSVVSGLALALWLFLVDLKALHGEEKE